MTNSKSWFAALSVCLAISMTPSLASAAEQKTKAATRSTTVGNGAIAEFKLANVQQLTAESISTWIQQRDGAKLYSYFSAEMKQIASEEGFSTLLRNFWNKDEIPLQIIEYSLNGARHLALTDEAGLKGINIWIIDDQITGIKLLPLQKQESDNYPTLQVYGLPFTDQWFVGHGGRNVLVNYHYAYPNQRYAYDFIIVRDGFSYQNDPTKNESYFAFGQQVLAPGDGKVVRVVNNIEDNSPGGVSNVQQLEGNVVVIDHGNGEFSSLAHFKKDSIVVKVGDSIKKGQLLGQCGNSGNSSEPHIHYQVSDSPDMMKGRSIRISFENEIDPIGGQFIQGQSQFIK